MKNVAAITRLTSMPIISAACRSYEVARIALPSWVRETKYVSAIISTIVPTMTMICARARWTPPGSMIAVDQSTPLFQLKVS